MNLILRLLWGRRWIVITAVLACLLGGLTVIYVSAPRYSGSARVILDYVKPDPTTGAVVPSKMLDAYLNSQLRLLRDNQVAIPAAESLGWLDNPDIQSAYANRDPNDRRDFQAWVAAQIVNGTSAHMVEDSNIMEITYNAPSKELAMAVAEALRTAYISSSIESARQNANAAADKTAQQIEALKTEIAVLQGKVQALEKANNIIVRPNGADEETAKLRNLARAAPDKVVSRGGSGTTPAELQLRALDTEIAKRGAGLGPNNPVMVDLQRQRAALVEQVRAEGDTAQSRAAALGAANRASAALLEAQKSRVLQLREPILQLKLLRDQLEQKSAVLEDLTNSFVNLRQEGAKQAGAITPVGPVTPSDRPVFPNPVLIIPASVVLGLMIGVLAALFVEFMGQRVRSLRDLELATQTTVLAVMPDLSQRRGRRGRKVQPEEPAAPALEVPS